MATQERLNMQYPLAPQSKWQGGTSYKATGGQVCTMSPDEYLMEVRPLAICQEAREGIENLKAHILAGGKLDPLAIYSNGKEDGRLRAVAAKELGIDELPVITWPAGFTPDWIIHP